MADTEASVDAAVLAADVPLGRRGGPKPKRNLREIVAGYIFIAPGLIHSAVFIVGMIIISGYLALTQWDLLTPPKFIGFENFQRLIHDEVFWLTLRRLSTSY